MVDFEKLLFQAQLSESANRHEKTYSLMEQVVFNKKEDLSAEERTLFANSYKFIISTKRASCNKINEIYVDEKRKESDHLNLILKLKNSIEAELKEACQKMLKILDDYLIPKAQLEDSKVLYFKLKGDYNRYLSTFFDNKTYIENALVAYKQATDLAEDLSCISPIKIELALSFSVFYMETLKNPEEAITIASDALNEGIDKLQKIEDSDMEDVTKALQMLKDNVEAWTKTDE
jgi:hypothetical protein